MNKKPKIAVMLLTGCGGCADRLSKLSSKLHQAGWDVRIDPPMITKFDYTIIAGAATQKQREKQLPKIRHNTDKVIAFGSCATQTGFNCLEKENKNPTQHMTTDYFIDGCPVDLNYAQNHLEKILSQGKQPKHVNVCLECVSKQNACILKSGGICFGPAARGGCGAVCTQNNTGCIGCMGALDYGAAQRLGKILQRKHGNRIKKLTNLYFGQGGDEPQ